VELRKIIRVGLLLAGLVFLASTTPVVAQYYGGGEDESQLILDKKLRSFPGNDFRDNIDKTVKVFYEDNLLEFSVLIKNSGNVSLENIKMTDQLPTNLSLIFHPGEYDKSIRAKISDTAVAGLGGQRCNKAEAWVDDISDSDTACYFVGGMEVPGTGDAGLIFKTIVVALTAGLGIGLRKFARGY